MDVDAGCEEEVSSIDARGRGDDVDSADIAKL